MAATDPLNCSAQWLSRLRDPAQAAALGVSERESCLGCATELLAAGRAEFAIPLLRELTRLDPTHAAAWRLLGFAQRDEQRMGEAAAAFERAANLQPEDALSALARAETAYARGWPAADLFAIARRLAPQDLQVLRGAALALAAEGQSLRAEELLESALVRRPDWLEGHKALCALRWARGDRSGYAGSFSSATRAQPQNQPLWLAWFSAVAQARDWAAARGVIEAAERTLGSSPTLLLARVFLASESGEVLEAERLFAASASLLDPVRELAYLRHQLRAGRLQPAEDAALRLTRSAAASSAWPYLSLIWRLRGDSRAAWLDGAPPYVRVIDLAIGEGELAELAALLRALHTARAPYLEQSVRGGTQTDGQLFFRGEAVIERTRLAIESAIREYVASLPPLDPGHPLRRGEIGNRILYGGSWSVRLQPQGYHVSHTHPKGWISSAFYVSVPPPDELGPAPAGCLRFGTPPSELGLDLPPYLDVEPQPGRLVLFPSTMWHQTVPFARGERLVLAFDVRAPRASTESS